jgi:hypothetical protein
MVKGGSMNSEGFRMKDNLPFKLHSSKYTYSTSPFILQPSPYILHHSSFILEGEY